MELQNKTLLESIKNIILQAREKAFRMINTSLLTTYWEIGRLIVEVEQKGNAKAIYGKETLIILAKELTLEFGKGFDESNLRNMRTFYNTFQKYDALRHELSWSHYRILSRIEEKKKREYYLQESIDNNWNTRNLQRQINSLAFERRIEMPTKDKEQTKHSFIKDPYIFEFLGLPTEISNTEFHIESSVISHLQQFLMELGKGFAFVARQQHICTDTSDFYIDLVFYNYILKCFVIIDLKTKALTHQDIGQLDMYVRMYDDVKRNIDDNPTIGILLCTQKDETIVKYSVLNDKNNLFASKYLLYLPKEEDLKKIIEEDRNIVENKNQLK